MPNIYEYNAPQKATTHQNIPTPMIEKRLKKLWENLQGKKPHMPSFLREIRLHGIRGIDGLRIMLDYPVSVIAGENASGKSTVLFAAACAYKVPGSGPKDYVPSTLFPDYLPKHGQRRDDRPEINIEYEYSTAQGSIAMRWRRRKGWNRSFFGRPKAEQPERAMYLRTLSNISNPSEVRSVLQMTHLSTAPQEDQLTAVQINFAQQMLPFEYKNVVQLSSGVKSLLFVDKKDGAAYSELHMASGERAILRLAREIAQLENALVLIDEVEAGLHPRVQQLLMLHLQQLALRNNLQIIVTTHSPVVLDAVPRNARIFLNRDEQGKVAVSPAYRDIIQDALYGRSHEVLNLLCEDDVAEGILHGIMDFLSPEQQIRRGSFRIGRDTGADEFAGHAKAFRKFGLIDNFVFVLDGDQRKRDIDKKIAEDADDQLLKVLFLPGDSTPEIWVWECLQKNALSWAKYLGLSGHAMLEEIKHIDAIYAAASDTPGVIAKHKLQDLAEKSNRDAPNICRIIAQLEAKSNSGDMRVLVNELKDILLNWRAN
ncbi:MAG: AAA family ATPase [Gammaproteobacteria bacterium]